jgi:hypothetical protein
MNLQIVWAAIQPILAQLLQSPQFKSVVDQIWSDLIAKIVAGTHPPDVATQQAQGQVAAAALLHLTGNPITDFAPLLAKLHPQAPVTGTFTS